MLKQKYTFARFESVGKMSHLAALILVAAVTPTSAQSGPDGVALKGVQIGAPIGELLARFPGSDCQPVPRTFRRLGDEQCTLVGPEAATYASAAVLEMTGFAIAGRFEGFSVTLSSWRDYVLVRDALRLRHGPGAEVTDVAQNTAGARVDSRTWSTTDGGVQISAVEHGSPLTQAVIDVASPALQERRRANPAAAGKDL